MKTFYFTNPTFDRHKGQEIRLKIESELKNSVALVSPFYDKGGNPTPEIRALDRGQKPEGVSENDIVETDIDMIREADGLIAWITNKTSWGSIQETYIAFKEMNKPVYIIFDPNTRGVCNHCHGFNPNAPGHPWPLKHSTRTFGNVEAFIAFAKEKYGPAQTNQLEQRQKPVKDTSTKSSSKKGINDNNKP